MDEDWVFAQDAEWDEETGELIHSMLEGAAEYAAGTATLVHKGKDDRPLLIHSVARVGQFEAGIRIDGKTGDAIWGYRDAPDRCENCGHRVDEDSSHTDSEGVVLCDDCWPLATVDA